MTDRADRATTRSPRVGLRAAIALALALTTTGALLALGGGNRTGTHRVSAEAPASRVVRVDLGARPIRRPMAALGAFWSIAQESNAGRVILVRVDGQSLQSHRIPDLASPGAIAAGFRSVWVTTCPSTTLEGNCTDGTVVRLDPAGQVIARIEVGGFLYPIAAGEGAVFVGRHSRDGSSVVRIDPMTNEVLSTTTLTDLPRSARCCVSELAAAEGAVWLMAGQRLARVDPTTLRASATDVQGDLMTAGQGYVWVNTSIGGPGHIVRVDPSNGRPRATIPSPGFAYPAIGGGRVWLAVPGTGSDGGFSIVLYRIDPSTDAIERVLDLPRGPAKASHQGLGGPVENVAVGVGATWVTDELAFQVIRIGARALAQPMTPTHPPAHTVARVDLGAIPIRQPLDFGALWTVVQSDQDESLHLLRVDRDTHSVRRVALGRLQPKLLAASDAVWVSGCLHPEPTTNCPDGTVYRLNPSTGRVTGRVVVGDNITALAATEDAVWVGQWKNVNNAPQPAVLLRIDPRTLAVHRYSLTSLRTKRAPCCIHMLAVGYDSVWMLFGDESRVVRMDIATGRFMPIDGYGSQIESDGNAVWLVGRTELDRRSVDHVFRIDAQTNGVQGPGLAAASVIVNGGSVWALQTSVFVSDRTLTVQLLDPITGQSVGQPVTVEAGLPKVNLDSVSFSQRVHGANGTWGGEVWVTLGDSLEAIWIDFVN